MKAILEFDMPDDDVEFRDAYDGFRYRTVLISLDNRMREVIKYSESPADYKQCAQDVRDEIREAAQEFGVTIDE